MYQFSVTKWSAWAPNISNQHEWLNFLAGSRQLDFTVKPDLTFLPAMKRRRLSPVAKAVLHAVNGVSAPEENIPSVFCSVYGEAVKTYDILKSISKHEDVSPTMFSLSVHNAIAGQVSLCFSNSAASTTICPTEHNYLSAFVDAISLLAEGEKEVLLVFYEDVLPDLYRSYTNTQELLNFPCTLALRLSAASSDSNEQPLQLSYKKVEAFDTKSFMLNCVSFLLNQQAQLQTHSWMLYKHE